MKTMRIDGRMQKVFVLRETDERIVYIPVKSCFLVDYKKLLELEKRGGDILKHMSNETLPNGRNALVQMDGLIEVLRKTGQEGNRLKKPDEAIVEAQLKGEEVPTKEEPKEEQRPARRKPGPRPKNKQPE